MEESLSGTLAIDLGNTNTVIAFQDQKDINSVLVEIPNITSSPGVIPTAVWYDEPSKILKIGVSALKMKNSSNSDLYFHSNFKRLIGNPIEKINQKNKILNEIDVDKPTISLLENIRFFEGEIKNDLNFSKSITDKLDLYVNEAFSASHRFHSSVNQMAKNILSAPGFNFEREILAIDKIKKSPKKKLAIIGGSKVSTKIKTLLSLTSSCSDIFIGGAMANNFFKYNSINVSNSLIEEGTESMIEMIYNSAKSTNCKIHLPSDVILDSNENKLIDELPTSYDFKILDISVSSHAVLEKLIGNSDIVLWNGPMGMIEDNKFSKGSVNLAHLLAKSQADVVIGGGDTILAINMAEEKFENFYFVSTAGGAFLEALENKDLPGIQALMAD